MSNKLCVSIEKEITRCIKVEVIICNHFGISAWAKKWLNGTDRSSKTADKMGKEAWDHWTEFKNGANVCRLIEAAASLSKEEERLERGDSTNVFPFCYR